MRTYVALLLCLLMSYLATSQNLKPIVHRIKSEPHFCFSLEQSRFLATQLELSVFQKQILDSIQFKEYQWLSLLQKKDNVIQKLELKIVNLETVNQNENIQIEVLNKTIQTQQRKLKRSKLERWVFGGGLLVLTGIIIAQ